MTGSKQLLRWRRVIAVTLAGVGAATGVACRSDLYSSVQQFATDEYGDGDEYGSGSGEYGDGSGEYGDGSGSDEYGGGDDGSGSDGSGSDGSGSDGSGSDGSGSDGTVDAGVGGTDSGSTTDGSVCGDGGTPQTSELTRALECVALMRAARDQYTDALTAAIAGYPKPGGTPPNGTSPTLSEVGASPAPPADIFGIPDSAQYAFHKLENYEPSFFADRVLTDPALYQCSQVLAALPMDYGYFGDRPYTPPPYPYPPPPTSTTNTCLNNPPPPPAEPPFNCQGVVVVAFVGYNAGEVLKDDTTKCDDHDREAAVTAATRNTGPVQFAFGGERKEAKQSRSGDNCVQAAPIIQNWEMGIAAKPAGVFIPEQILEQKPGQAAQWVSNAKSKMLYYVYPDQTGKPVKRGPMCRKDTELTMRTTADMHLPYYIHARVFNDKNGYSGGSQAYQAQVDLDQRCYGPGTNVTNPGSFAVVQSEHESKAQLKVVIDCQKEQAWNANFNIGASMGEKPGGSFGFGGGVSETLRCAQNRDIDNLASGGCFANQNFGNVAMTTKKLNGPFAIGTVYTFFNPNDPAAATAPLNWLQMGMKMIGASARATSSISTDWKGVAGAALATILTDRKMWTDKPAEAKAKVKMGSGGCALVSENTPRPATECQVPVADWPFLPKIALDKVPTNAQMNETFDKLVQGIKDAAAK